jgi:GNAT superfamily N-acetyltransferase
VKPELVDGAVDAWYEAIRAFALLQPGGQFREGKDGTRLLITGAQMAFLNGVLSSARVPDAEAIAALVPPRETFGVPWSIQVRGDQPNQRIVDLATECGKEQHFSLPFMVRLLDDSSEHTIRTDSLIIRRATVEDHFTYQAAMAAGFEGPVELFSPFSAPAVLSAPRMTAWLAEEQGIPVGTGFGVHVRDWVGIFNISTHPNYRSRGYGKAMIATVLRDAFEAGVRGAFLHGTPAGVLLYESMGFTRAENWTVFVSS